MIESGQPSERSRLNHAASRESSLTPASSVVGYLLIGEIFIQAIWPTLEMLMVISVLISLLGVSLIRRRELEWALDQVSAEWQLPQKTQRGHVASVRIMLTNPSPLDLWGLEVVIKTPEGLSSIAYCDLLAYSCGEVSGYLRCHHYHAGHIWGLELCAHDRLKMTSAARHLIKIQKLEISPAPPRISWRMVRQAPRSTTQSSSQRSARQTRGRDGDFSELRLYQPSDGLRSVAWRPSARRGQLLSRISEQHLEQRYLFALDLAPTMRGLVGHESRVSLALDLLYGWLPQLRGEQVGLIAFDHRVMYHVPIAPQAKVITHLNELSSYAAQPLDSDCVINSTEEIWSQASTFLEWSGLGFHSPLAIGQSELQRLRSPLVTVDAYQLELTAAYINNFASQEVSLPEVSLDPHREHHHLRRFCHHIGLAMTARLPRIPRALAEGLHAVLKAADQQRATQLIFLSHRHRVSISQRALHPLNQWARHRGGVCWIEIGTQSSERPRSLREIPLQYLPMRLPPANTLRSAGVPKEEAQSAMSFTRRLDPQVLRTPPWTWINPQP